MESWPVDKVEDDRRLPLMMLAVVSAHSGHFGEGPKLSWDVVRYSVLAD
jgi:hypothetical protein